MSDIEARWDTLDADATQVESWKRQARFTYQEVKGYMPMLGYLFETGGYDEFREGNRSPGSGQLCFYRVCKRRIPKGKCIGRYRADSASYQAKLINALEADEVIWAITADQDQAVKTLIDGIPEGEWKEPVGGCGYEVAETVHTMNKTQRVFRLIIKRELRRQGDLYEEQGQRYFHHAVASNWSVEQKRAEEVLQWHNLRGQAENFNRELKRGFGMEQMPCGGSWANVVFFRIGVIAYNLFMGFKGLSCPQDWVHHTTATFRWNLPQGLPS